MALLDTDISNTDPDETITENLEQKIPQLSVTL